MRAMRSMMSARSAASMPRKTSAQASWSSCARMSAQVCGCSPRSSCATAAAGMLRSSSTMGDVVASGATRLRTSRALAWPSDFSRTFCAFSTPPRAEVTASSVTEENSSSRLCCTSAERNSMRAISAMICSICRWLKAERMTEASSGPRTTSSAASFWTLLSPAMGLGLASGLVAIRVGGQVRRSHALRACEALSGFSRIRRESSCGVRMFGMAALGPGRATCVLVTVTPPLDWMV